MAAGSSDSLAGMFVEFGADYTQMTSAGASIGAIFAEIESSAAGASAGVTESMTAAAEAVDTLSSAISADGEAQMALSDVMAQITSMADMQQSAVSADGEAMVGLGRVMSDLAAFADQDAAATAALAEQQTGAAAAADYLAMMGERAATAQTSQAQAARSAASAEAEAGDAASAASEGGLMSLVSSAGMALFGLQAIVQIGGQLASSLLGPATSAETVTSALTVMDGSARKAAQEMLALNEFAAKTPFRTLDIDHAAMELQGFGFSAQGVIPMITAIGDALGSVGRETPAELDSVIQIFGKMRTEGKVTTMMMNELAVHGIDGWKALSDATGKPIPVLQEMVKKGLIPANQAIADLTTGIEKNPLYKGGMARAADTFTGLLSTLQSDWDQVIAAFGTPIIQALEGQLSNLGNTLASPAFQQFAGSVGAGIVQAFKDIGGAVSGVASFFGGIDLKGVGSSFKQLGDGIGAIAGPFERLFSNKAASGFFSTLKNDLSGGIVDAIKGISGFISSLATDLIKLSQSKEFNAFLGSLKSGFQAVSQIVGGSLSADFKFFQGILTDLGKWWQSDMMPAIKAAMPGFEHLGSVIATTVIPGFAKLWAVGQQLFREVVGPAVKEFEAMEPVIVRVAGFLADNLGKALQVIVPDIVSAAQAVATFVGDIESRAQPIIEALSIAIKGFLNWIGPYWPSIWRAISSVFAATWDTIKGTFQIAWSLFSGSWKVMLDIATGHWKQAWDDIKGIFSGVWDGIKTIFSGVWGVIQADMKLGLNVAIGIINSFIKGLDSIGIDVGPVHIHPNIPTIPLLATGGFVAPGSVAVAGDAGPELVIGGASGATVLSHAASMAAVGGAGGGRQDIHVHVYLDGMELTNQLGMNILNMVRVGGPVGQVT